MHTHNILSTGGKCGNGATTYIEARDGILIMEKEKILGCWYKYIRDLDNDNASHYSSWDHGRSVHVAVLQNNELSRLSEFRPSHDF